MAQSSVAVLAKRIRLHCRRERISLNQLAQLSGLSHPTVHSLTSKKVRCTLATLDKIATGMRIEPWQALQPVERK